MRPAARHLFVGSVVGALVAGVLLLDGQTFGVVEKIDRPLGDLRTRYYADTTPFTDKILIVDINEESIRALEPVFGRWPWPRSVHGWLVNYLYDAGVEVVGFDVIFAERTRRAELDERRIAALIEKAREEGGEAAAAELERLRPGRSDEDLAAAAALAGNVYFASIFTVDEKVRRTNPGMVADEARVAEVERIIGRFGFSPPPDVPRVPVFYDATPPLDVLADGAAGVGHINFFPDPDGPCRSSFPFVSFHGKYYPSLAVSLAAHHLGKSPRELLAEGALPLSANGELLIRYQGGRTPSPWRKLRNWAARRLGRGGEREEDFRSYYKGISYHALLWAMNMERAGREDEIPPELKRDFLKGKIVLVGATAAGLLDLRATPFASITPGVEIHANVIDNILARRFLRPLPEGVWILALFAVSILTGLGAAYFTWGKGLLFNLLIAGAAEWAAWTAYPLGYAVPLAPPLVAALATYMILLLFKYAVEEREKRRVRGAFGHYLAASVLEEVLANPEALRLGGERRHMSVLFSDLAGFTTISERSDAEEVAKILNEYLTHMTDCVHENGGTLDKFMGDAVMAEWNAPGHQEDHAARACRTALRMHEKLGDLQKKWKEEGREVLSARIGINTGEMVVGNMGSDDLFDYTVVGNEVNTGARLEPLNKDFGTCNLVSETTRKEAEKYAPGEFLFREVARVAVKGRTTALGVYELVGFAEKVPDSKKKAVEAFERGMERLRSRDKAGARAAFEEALRHDPEDGPSKAWLAKVDELPPDWDGVYVQTTK